MFHTANELLHLQIAALMKIPFLDEEMPSANEPFPPKVLGSVPISFSQCLIAYEQSLSFLLWSCKIILPLDFNY